MVLPGLAGVLAALLLQALFSGHAQAQGIPSVHSSRQVILTPLQPGALKELEKQVDACDSKDPSGKLGPLTEKTLQCLRGLMRAAAGRAQPAFKAAVTEMVPFVRKVVGGRCKLAADYIVSGADCGLKTLAAMVDDLENLQRFRREAPMQNTGAVLLNQLNSGKHFAGTVLGEACGKNPTDNCFDVNLLMLRAQIVEAHNHMVVAQTAILEWSYFTEACGSKFSNDVACYGKENWSDLLIGNEDQIPANPKYKLPGKKLSVKVDTSKPTTAGKPGTPDGDPNQAIDNPNGDGKPIKKGASDPKKDGDKKGDDAKDADGKDGADPKDGKKDGKGDKPADPNSPDDPDVKKGDANKDGIKDGKPDGDPNSTSKEGGKEGDSKEGDPKGSPNGDKNGSKDGSPDGKETDDGKSGNGKKKDDKKPDEGGGGKGNANTTSSRECRELMEKVPKRDPLSAADATDSLDLSQEAQDRARKLSSCRSFMFRTEGQAQLLAAKVKAFRQDDVNSAHVADFSLKLASMYRSDEYNRKDVDTFIQQTIDAAKRTRSKVPSKGAGAGELDALIVEMESLQKDAGTGKFLGMAGFDAAYTLHESAIDKKLCDWRNAVEAGSRGSTEGWPSTVFKCEKN